MKKPNYKQIEQARKVLVASGILDSFWHQDDILGAAKERGIELTKREVQDIADFIVRKHDANIGINWDTINIFTDMYLEENKKP